MTPDEIELYKDIVKIGIPALVGLLAGLIPFFLERNKLNQAVLREGREFRRNQIIELIDCFSKHSGSFSVYTTRLLSMEYNGENKFLEKVENAADIFLDNEFNFIKAKAISGLLDGDKLVKAFHEYDRQISLVIKFLGANSIKSYDEKKLEVVTLKEKENKLIIMFNELS